MRPEHEVRPAAPGGRDPGSPGAEPRKDRYRQDLTQYEAAARKRTLVSALIIFLLIPATMLFGVAVLDQNLYMVISLLVVIYTLIPFFMVYERRRPKAREIVLIAMMAALTTVIHVFFHVTIPVQAGTAMVIISGIALGPEAGFLVGALARLVCNFYLGQGPWTPWQMVCWGLLGFLAGLAFNRVDPATLKKREKPLMEISAGSFRSLLAPLICLLFAAAAAWVSYLIWPGKDATFFGWRLYVFGAIGLLAGVLLQRRRLPADSLTMAVFTFFTTFIIYGGIMNICAMVNASVMPGADPVSFAALRLLYVAGVPYDAVHAATAAAFIFLFGSLFVQKLERVRIKYGIYR